MLIYHMGKQPPSALGIDRGTRYIGLAYRSQGTDISMPIGYILNDKMTLYTIADLVRRHRVSTIVIGYPRTQENIQKKIKAFLESLEFVIDKNEIDIALVNEDYTSIQSGDIISNFKKNAAEDTVSAMLILDRRAEKK